VTLKALVLRRRLWRAGADVATVSAGGTIRLSGELGGGDRGARANGRKNCIYRRALAVPRRDAVAFSTVSNAGRISVVPPSGGSGYIYGSAAFGYLP